MAPPQSWRAPLAGIAACAALAAALFLAPDSARQMARERVFDALLALAASWRPAAPAPVPVVTVEIDAASLAAIGPWPWPRGRIAELIGAVARGGARAVAVDILFAGADARSPAEQARHLAASTGRADLAAWADSLEDGDRLLAAALAAHPVALGFALDPQGTEAPTAAPILASGPPMVLGLWRAGGAVAPAAELQDAASGLGALALPGDADGLVRRLPLLVAAAGQVQPGLAAEALRLGEAASAYRLDGAAGVLRIGGVAVRLPYDGMLRLLPGAAQDIPVLPAAALLRGGADVPGLRDAIVLIGGAAPELGGLRATRETPLLPSVRLHAAAVAQMLRGAAPLPPSDADTIAGLASLLCAAAAMAAALWLRPVRGAAALGLLLMLGLAAGVAAAARDVLLDVSLPLGFAATAFAATALVAAAETQLREARIRQRFGQHLSPQLVARIAASPGLLKLAGERREVTVLFTDVEGFTALTRRAGAEALVAMLDGYFEGVTSLILAHGGMVDRLVGDAVHGFFNMPLDLPDHPARALDCAEAIVAWTEAWRATGLAAQHGFGRTRIGLETGPAIVGDVGSRTKLEYTAYGETVNAAARLETGNKDLGSSICVGPVAAARCKPGRLRPAGWLRPRGFDTVLAAFTPWPQGTAAEWRAAYLAAFALAGSDPARAAAQMQALADACPQDGVARNLARGITPPGSAALHSAPH